MLAAGRVVLSILAVSRQLSAISFLNVSRERTCMVRNTEGELLFFNSGDYAIWAAMALLSVSEVPHSGENHGQAEPVSGLDDLLIAD